MVLIMKLYDKIQKTCKYGYFNTEKPASYTVTDSDQLTAPWYYIYNNRKILLYVDQNGPVKIQYQPPNGILPIKREMGETSSKWQVWVQADDLNCGIPVSNFHSPALCCNSKKPEFTVQWSPETAIYTAKYDAAEIITEIFVPWDKATVCMKTTIINTTEKEMQFTVTPALFPYMNIPQMVAWDLPEWYLSTKAIRMDDSLTIHGQMTSPEMDKTLNRSITWNIDYDASAQIELDMAAFCGSGNFFSPKAVIDGSDFRTNMENADGMRFGSHQSVYTARYRFTLGKGECKTLTQVLTVQEDIQYNPEENRFERIYFDDKSYTESVAKTRDFYQTLFGKRRVKTDNPLYDNFINTFAPLEMFWVCSLDRGWPSSMRGIRDCSQDFMGMLPLDPAWTRESIKTMFSHQRADGWMPRQISTISRSAPHDMRYYCDGGAFLLELVHEYLTFTRDADILFERVYWLDSDEESTILAHVQRCMQFYLDKKNIGEHGLCKVWYGDWWDPMDKIGMEGRGESVTTTAQTVLNLQNLADMFVWLHSIGKVDRNYLQLAADYLAIRQKFIDAMQQHAYNKEGFFNGYFNDNGKWLLSNQDPDGERRVYLVSNAWAIISGCATENMQNRIFDILEKECVGAVGYNTSSKGFPVYIEKAGRTGNGNSPGTNTYNHAQSFFVRACCECGRAELAYQVTRHILPIEEEYTPVEKTFAPPYAIVNMYSNNHRAGFQFLSGTVSYVLRTVYHFFFGITYGYDGLTISPCIPKAFGNCSVEFTYLGKAITVCFRQTQDGEKTAAVNGTLWNHGIGRNGKWLVFFRDSDLQSNAKIDITY